MICEPFRDGYRCKCEKCGEMFTRDYPSSLCLGCRTVYSSRKDGERLIEIEYKNEKWFVLPVLHFFKRNKPTSYLRQTEWQSSAVFPTMDTENLAKKLSQTQPISKTQLYKLFQDSIKKGIYTSLSGFEGKIIRIDLALDSWLNGQRKNSRSKWVPTTPPQIASIMQKQSEKMLESA